MKKQVYWLTCVGCLAVLMGVALVVPLSADDDHATGRLGQETVRWWQWFMSLPATNHPVFDETGANAGAGQANHQVFYLLGVFNETGEVHRTITVPLGKPLFGAIVNYENDNIFYDPPVGVGQLRKDAASFFDTVEGLTLTLDGISRLDLVSRIKSPVFEYVLPEEDNLYGGYVSGIIRPAVSDGYWFYIPNLPRGTHTLHFRATNPTFGGNIYYTITVN